MLFHLRTPFPGARFGVRAELRVPPKKGRIHTNFNIKIPTLISLLYSSFPVILCWAAGPQASRINQMLLAYRNYTAVHTAALLCRCSGLCLWEMALLFFFQYKQQQQFVFAISAGAGKLECKFGFRLFPTACAIIGYPPNAVRCSDVFLLPA